MSFSRCAVRCNRWFSLNEAPLGLFKFISHYFGLGQVTFNKLWSLNCSISGYTSITCTQISNIPYNLIPRGRGTKYNTTDVYTITLFQSHMSFYTCLDWPKKLRLFVNERNLWINVILKACPAVVIDEIKKKVIGCIFTKRKGIYLKNFFYLRIDRNYLFGSFEITSIMLYTPLQKYQFKSKNRPW
jgi:hypothetical protein